MIGYQGHNQYAREQQSAQSCPVLWVKLYIPKDRQFLGLNVCCILTEKQLTHGHVSTPYIGFRCLMPGNKSSYGILALAEGATQDSGGRERPYSRGRLRSQPVLLQYPLLLLLSAHSPLWLFSDRLHQVLRLLMYARTLSEIVGLILATDSCGESVNVLPKVVGFLRALRFPPTRKVDSVC